VYTLTPPSIPQNDCRQEFTYSVSFTFVGCSTTFREASCPSASFEPSAGCANAKAVAAGEVRSAGGSLETDVVERVGLAGCLAKGKTGGAAAAAEDFAE
jgi:hypothetical protein